MNRLVLLLIALAVLAVVLPFTPTSASSSAPLRHGGGLDALGCHNDNKARQYHCHRGSCSGITFGSKNDAIKAGCHQ